MKTRTYVSIMILVLAVLIVAGSCATSKKALPTDNIDELVGTWANPQNNLDRSGHYFGKIVFKADKTADLYARPESELPGWHFTSIDLKEKWKDRDSNYFYGAYLKHPVATSYGFMKISSDGKTLEMMFLTSATGLPQDMLPTEIDTTAGRLDQPSYHIWYRQ